MLWQESAWSHRIRKLRGARTPRCQDIHIPTFESHWILSSSQHYSQGHQTRKSSHWRSNLVSQTLWFWFCSIFTLCQDSEFKNDRLCSHSMVQIPRASDSSKLWKRSRHLGYRVHDGRAGRRRRFVPWRIRHRLTLPYSKSPGASPSTDVGAVLSKPFFHRVQIPWCFDPRNTWG